MFHEEWLEEVHVNEWAVIDRAKDFEYGFNKSWKTLESIFLLKAVTVIDLTTLGGDDTNTNVTALANKAVQPLCGNLVKRTTASLHGLIYHINSMTAERKNSIKIDFTKSDDRKYNIKIIGNADIFELNGKNELSYEALLEVKQILKMLRLTNKENVNEDLAKFLSLKTDNAGERKNLRVAAICVYPKFVGVVADTLRLKGLLHPALDTPSKKYDCCKSGTKSEPKRQPLKEDTQAVNVDAKDSSEEKGKTEKNLSDFLPIAAVAAGFPSGLYDLESKIKEITYAVQSGATEIDIVISRYLVLGHRWLELFDEVCTLKKACGAAKMKTILAVGECGSLENIYKASMVSMMAGSDYIKTSTGKETINATFPFGLVMCRAIKDYYIKTGTRVGFKAAGGIRTADDAIKWIRMVIIEMGVDWLPYFRIGASGVLKSIEQRLTELNS